MLSRGRSFRNNKYRTLINDQQDSCTVFGEVSLRHYDDVVPLGVQRNRDGSQQIKINGKPATSAAQLAELVPTQVINPDALAILEGGPAIRRQFVDWGVFHVEHRFLHHWQRANRALKQRNEMLRRGKMDASLMAAWDRVLIEHAEKLQQLRGSYVERLKPLFEKALNKLTDIDLPELSLAAGWDERMGLAEVFKRSAEQDRKAGFTQHGPHRADLRVRLDGRKVADLLSRGQQKIIVSALKLAQGALFNLVNGRQCIFLVDDLVAELDAEHRQRLFKSLVETESQLWVTSIDADVFDVEGNYRAFHVKQGNITPAN